MKKIIFMSITVVVVVALFIILPPLFKDKQKDQIVQPPEIEQPTDSQIDIQQDESVRDKARRTAQDLGFAIAGKTYKGADGRIWTVSTKTDDDSYIKSSSDGLKQVFSVKDFNNTLIKATELKWTYPVTNFPDHTPEMLLGYSVIYDNASSEEIG